MAEPIASEPSRDAQTEVIPPMVVEVAAPRKRHRLRLVIILLAVLVLLVVAFLVADGAAKRYATGYVKDNIVEVLQLPPGTPVDVDLGGGSIILQAIAGGIDKVTVDVRSLTFGELTGAAHLVATNVPLDSSQPLDQLGITVTMSQGDVRTLATSLSGLQLDTIEVGEGVITIGTELDVLFFAVPVAVDLEPSARDGAIGFEPKTVRLGGSEISVPDLLATPQLGDLAADLLRSRQVCVASYLPEALIIRDVRVEKTNLVVTIDGDGTALGGSGLSTNGTCPAG